MSDKNPIADLSNEGVRSLIRLTNDQFKTWKEVVEEEALLPDDKAVASGDLMDLWFILSNLALQDAFVIPKKDAYGFIPALAQETVRKYVERAQALALVETVRSGKQINLRLTRAGERAIARTLARWIDEFGAVQRKFFSDRGQGDDNT